MKKLLSMVITFALLLSVVGVAHSEEWDEISLTPYHLSDLDFTASEWYADDTHRVFLAASALLDVIATGNEDFRTLLTEATYNNGIYVGKDGLTLYIFFAANEETLLLAYIPLAGTLEAVPFDIPYRDILTNLDDLISIGYFETYHQIDSEKLITACSVIMDSKY